MLWWIEIETRIILDIKKKIIIIKIKYENVNIIKLIIIIKIK
jgi:hypothetical protein